MHGGMKKNCMSKWDRLIEKIPSAESDHSIRFDELCHLLGRRGWVMRIRGSHHVFEKPGFKPLNLQPIGPNAKSYQVRQVCEAIQEELE
jgi:hypothetical protein